MIKLKEITNENVWKVCKLEPFEDQKDFVAANIESLAEAYATRNEGNNALPLAAYNNDDLVGFVMIGKGSIGESELVSESYCIWRLMVDKNFQGQGFGKEIINAAIDLIPTFPYSKSKKVWLSYEAENIRAREIYKNYGFVENGEMCEDEIIAVYEL